jgi:hypothetical protein
MSDEPVDLRPFTMRIVMINECLKAVLSAIDDPRLDCEATMRDIKEKTLEAQEHVQEMLKPLLPADFQPDE